MLSPPHEASIRAANNGTMQRRLRVIGTAEPSIGKCAYDAVFVVPLRRFRAAFRSGFRGRAANPTVAGELKRLAAEGKLTPEDAAAKRAIYDDAKARRPS